MATPKRIEFRESSTTATDFLHELNDPALLRSRVLPPRATRELRKQQLARLRENIGVLTRKRDEFNRKMEHYIENLRALIRSVEKSVKSEGEERPEGGDPAGTPSTLVRCLGCDTQQFFRRLEIVFARESEDAFDNPTEVYVLDAGDLKKGHFTCRACGERNLVIRSV